MRTIKTAAALLIVAGAFVGARTAGSQLSGDPRSIPVPQVVMPSGKTMIATMTFRAGQAPALNDAEVVYGQAPGLDGRPNELHVTVLGRGGGTLQTFNAGDPLRPSVYDGRHNHRPASQGTGTFAFPFDPRVETMSVRDAATQTPVATVDLTPASREFCQSNPKDADCASDLRVSVSDAPDPVAAGTDLTYTIKATNDGPAPAQAARVKQTLPSGLSFSTGSTGCSSSGADVTCDIGYMGNGETKTVSVTASVAPDLVYNNGSPLDVSSWVSVENAAGAELDPSDNAESETTRVVAVADLAVTQAGLDSGVSRIVIGRNVDVTLSTTVTSDGPSSPMDALVTTAASAASGTTASAPVTTTVTALASGEKRTLQSGFELGCVEPGLHTFSFTTSIEPARPDDTDPDSSNDSMSQDVTVDCVIPVAFNIKPGSKEDPVNLGSRGVIPTTVLTTKAGEYGLPIAVDATRIVATTVHFGPERLVFNDRGGATEFHGKGHPEDSYELDGSTRDGDRDLEMHFRTQDAGLAVLDTEACVLGTIIGARGERYTFFGCDEIRYVP